MRQEVVKNFEDAAKSLASLALDIVMEEKMAAGPLRPAAYPAIDSAVVALEALLTTVVRLMKKDMTE